MSIFVLRYSHITLRLYVLIRFPFISVEVCMKDKVKHAFPVSV